MEVILDPKMDPFWGLRDGTGYTLVQVIRAYPYIHAMHGYALEYTPPKWIHFGLFIQLPPKYPEITRPYEPTIPVITSIATQIPTWIVHSNIYTHVH